ncbi:MAG: cation diffusion facilitator family transporter, partial [Myxococcota bacterium]
GHGHGHGHVHTDSRSALRWALGLNAAFLLVEVGVGWWSGSLALLSDASHMVSDVGALALAIGAATLATRRASARMTYGLARAEVLGAFVNGLGLLAVCAWIVREGLTRLMLGPPPVPGTPVLVVGVIGLAINLGSAWALHGADPNDLNARGALLHMLSDALGSVAAIVAAGLLMLGYPGADPVASLIVGVLVAIGAIGLVRDAGRVLLELPPSRFDVQRLQAALAGVAGVCEVHDLHVWSVDGRTPLVSVHLVLAEAAPSDGVIRHARGLLRDAYGVRHATIQVDRTGDGCATRCGDVG